MEQSAALRQWDAKELQQELSRSRQRLLGARSNRVPPAKDDKILVSWNALMIDALARGGGVLQEARYLDAARRAAEFLLQSLRREDGRLLHSWRQGRPRFDAYLDDYAYLANALVTLYDLPLKKCGSTKPSHSDDDDQAFCRSRTRWLLLYGGRPRDPDRASEGQFGQFRPQWQRHGGHRAGAIGPSLRPCRFHQSGPRHDRPRRGAFCSADPPPPGSCWSPSTYCPMQRRRSSFWDRTMTTPGSRSPRCTGNSSPTR